MPNESRSTTCVPPTVSARAEPLPHVSAESSASTPVTNRMLDTAALGWPATAVASPAAIEAEAVLDRLYRAHGGALAAVGRMLTGSVEAGEDLAQEVFMDVFTRLQTNPSFLREPAWPYLRCALLHLAMKRRRRIALELRRLAQSWDARSTQMGIPMDTDSEVIEALRELPTRMRMCVVLALVEDQPHGDIARSMSISVRTVDHQLRLARVRLGKRLAHLRATQSPIKEDRPHDRYRGGTRRRASPAPQTCRGAALICPAHRRVL
jgi:DNA-directed RNA polymerase specialized sigma24 family protein